MRAGAQAEDWESLSWSRLRQEYGAILIRLERVIRSERAPLAAGCRQGETLHRSSGASGSGGPGLLEPKFQKPSGGLRMIETVDRESEPRGQRPKLRVRIDHGPEPGQFRPSLPARLPTYHRSAASQGESPKLANIGASPHGPEHPDSRAFRPSGRGVPDPADGDSSEPRDSTGTPTSGTFQREKTKISNHDLMQLARRLLVLFKYVDLR